MDKVICDICGTSYPATEENCPICGCSREVHMDMDLELDEEDLLLDSPVMAARKKMDLNASAHQDHDWDEDDDEDEDEDDEDDEPRRGNTGVVILLVVLIMLLLAAAGFLLLRYVLPNMGIGQTEPTQAVMETEATVETTTEPGIPCEQLILTSGSAVDLTREGEYKLIHVMVKPEDTTDELIYVSSDESVVTVTKDGRLTAVSEGEATITIICGYQRMECRVYVHYVEETEPTTEETTVPETEETVPEETEDETVAEEETVATEETEAAEETVAEEESTPAEEETEPTEEVTEPAEEETVPETTEAQLKNVTLKLGRTDVSLNVGYSFTIPLECDLEYSEIEWSTGNPGIATIKDGVITALAKGTTQLIVKYGDQTVTGWIRVR